MTGTAQMGPTGVTTVKRETTPTKKCFFQLISLVLIPWATLRGQRRPANRYPGHSRLSRRAGRLEKREVSSEARTRGLLSPQRTVPATCEWRSSTELSPLTIESGCNIMRPPIASGGAATSGSLTGYGAAIAHITAKLWTFLLDRYRTFTGL